MSEIHPLVFHLVSQVSYCLCDRKADGMQMVKFVISHFAQFFFCACSYGTIEKNIEVQF